MLGRTAGGLFWMFRNLERSENTARLVDAGFRIALTRSKAAEAEWASVVTTAGVREAYRSRYERFTASGVIDFLLRDRENPSSVINSVEQARRNAREVRTALTREVWETTNESWMTLTEELANPVKERDLPDVLATIRQQSALVRGALQGTMLRNDVFNFTRLGTFVERADSTARLLDVKYYVLLPRIAHVGTSLDNVQWETILRAASAHRAYQWLKGGDIKPLGIAELLILDPRLPRSLRFCCDQLTENLGFLAGAYGERLPSHDMADAMRARLAGHTIDGIFDPGLHEFLTEFIRQNNALGLQIEEDYRFYR